MLLSLLVALVVVVIVVVKAYNRHRSRVYSHRQSLEQEMELLSTLQARAAKLLQEQYSGRLHGDDDALEIARSRIKLGREIGSGAFAVVRQAQVVSLDAFTGGATVDVAAKLMKDNVSDAARVHFLMEARLMAAITHPKIITLIGVCTASLPFMIITQV